MNTKLILILILFFGISSAQENSFHSEDISINSIIDGTLLIPNNTGINPLVIIIQGSGPVDRNGNQSNLQNNSLKYLAEGLYKKHIASFRYDKRLVKQILEGKFRENDIRFDDYIDDAILVTEYFINDKQFSKIIILGHSQGSLVGMIAAQNRADAYISISGAGHEIDDVVIYQLKKQAPGLTENARQSFDDLRVNGVSQNYKPELATIFRPSLQLFMLSWMQYDPQEEISKLDIPVLIINGDKDIQVQVSEAEKLKAAKQDAQYKIISNMNHILKEIKGGMIENQKSYNDHSIPVMSELIDVISSFIFQ